MDKVKICMTHSDEVRVVLFSPDGKHIASGSDDATIKIWNTNEEHEVTTLESHSNAILALDFHPDGKMLVSSSLDNTIIIWDLDAKDKIKVINAHSDKIWNVKFTTDGKKLISGSEDQTLRVWDIKESKEIFTVEDTIGIDCLAISPDGKTVAWGSGDLVKMWDIVNYCSIKTSIKRCDTGINCLSFSPDGTKLLQWLRS